jgi:hypothetical protein
LLADIWNGLFERRCRELRRLACCSVAGGVPLRCALEELCGQLASPATCRPKRSHGV